MKLNLFAVIWIDGAIAFLIPFLTTLAAALSPYILADSAQPGTIGWLVILCAPVVAGLSALKSFMSTTFSDAKDDLTPDAKPASLPPTP